MIHVHVAQERNIKKASKIENSYMKKRNLSKKLRNKLEGVFGIIYTFYLLNLIITFLEKHCFIIIPKLRRWKPGLFLEQFAKIQRVFIFYNRSYISNRIGSSFGLGKLQVINHFLEDLVRFWYPTIYKVENEGIECYFVHFYAVSVDYTDRITLDEIDKNRWMGDLIRT